MAPAPAPLLEEGRRHDFACFPKVSRERLIVDCWLWFVVKSFQLSDTEMQFPIVNEFYSSLVILFDFQKLVRWMISIFRRVLMPVPSKAWIWGPRENLTIPSPVTSDIPGKATAYEFGAQGECEDGDVLISHLMA